MSQLILVVDDEASLVNVVRGYLEQAGFQVVTASNGREALFAAREHQPDLIILDLMMPVMDGFTFIREYQREGTTPIIALTARMDEMDKVLGLEMGADDYITKPFSPRELVARVRALLRRAGSPQSESNLLRAGDLVLNRDARVVVVDGQEWELTPMEFGLLETLMSNPGRAFSRMELLERTQGFAYDGYERTVDVHIKNLRKKIEEDPGNPNYVLTVFGVGYRFNSNL
ncbi:MAG: response regulator transcription factor [Anaerolineaceae bacterium]|nr:response regulator [Chloroflexota bacterium]UCC52067.1 MAG: response regulator transcription factor [Anaerolineaceae bacterium]